MVSVFCFSPGIFAEKHAVTEELDLSLGELLNLEISIATKSTTTMQEAPSIVSVITGGEIKNMGARNLADVLRTVPGFDATDVLIVPGHQIEVRGMKTTRSLNKFKIMRNGHAMNFGATVFDIFPVANIRCRMIFTLEALLK